MVELRPVPEPDTLRPPPMPTLDERNAAEVRALTRLSEIEAINLQQAELARRQREAQHAYRADMAIVYAYDVEANP